MPPLKQALDELVTANRILAHEQVVDAFGHVSIRHPEAPDRYLMSRARAPECIELADLMEFTLDGTPIESSARKAYAERHIHGAIYETQPAVRAIVHNHSPGIIPFGITGTPLRPVMHMCASMGARSPDLGFAYGLRRHQPPGDEHGDGPRPCSDPRPRLRWPSCAATVASSPAVRCARSSSTPIYLELNAELQMKAAVPRRHHLPQRRRNRGGARHAQLVHLRAGLGVLVPASRARVRLPPDGRALGLVRYGAPREAARGTRPPQATEPGPRRTPRSRKTSAARAVRCGTPGARDSPF